MPRGKKATKNIKKEVTKNINTLRHYFPSLLIKFNQCLSKLPEDVKSNDENLMALFRTMWKINLLIKNILGDDAVTHIQQIQVDESCIDMKSTLREVYKTMWKLK
ncbi:unnamed protein product [Macrosiphum euphorbiae]|uniref:Uncharacterized protein n=1 Tax=Macrosiphum euphorbiae TaxID=13131 RepID=A0AAV0XJF1_9HEMI|nr:unnamed protein product [Macrosiphum euphorbiae]